MIRKTLLAALLLAACSQSAPDAAAAPARRPAHVEVGGAVRPAHPGRTEIATFAGGCFWSAESDIEDVPGVVSAVSGYTGGRVSHPSYEQVSGGGTGHLEAVRVSFDPARVSYAALAHRFMRTIDPTDPNGQFCDQGDNYRTALFVSGPAQRQAAEAAVAEANRILHGRVVTPVRAAGPFWPAEAYHQDYARRNPVAYGLYRRGCGRDARLRQIWGAQAVTHPGY